MSDDSTVNIKVGIQNTAEFTKQADTMGKAVHQFTGEVVKGADGFSNMERAAIRALETAFKHTQKLHGALGETKREVKALEKMMLDFGRSQQALRAIASGGPTAAITGASRRGMIAQQRLDPIYQLDETEKALLDIQKRRVAHFQRRLKQEEAALARGDTDGNLFQGVRARDGTFNDNPAARGVQRANAKAYNKYFGLGISERTDGKTSAEFEQLIQYVEAERRAYVRTAALSEKKFLADRRDEMKADQRARIKDLRAERNERINEERRFFADSRKQFTGVNRMEMNRRANLLIDQAVARQATAGASSGTQRQVRNALEADLNTVNARNDARQQYNRDTRSTQTPGERGVAATLDRVTTGGGAGLFAIQGQIMGNYLAMGAIMSTFTFLTRFTTELEQALAQVQAISASTDTEMQSLSKTILTVAGDSRIAAKDVADAATLMAQAGLSARDIASALGPITELAVGTGTNLAETVDIVTSVMSAFKLQTGEASQVANILTATMNKSKLGIQQFALGVQYAGNTASEMGVSYSELGAALAGMADNGVRAGSTLGTGMRQLLVDLQSPTKAAAQVFDDLGLSADELDVKSQGLFGVLRNLRDAGFDSADAYEALEVRAAAAYTAMTADLPAIEKLNLEILGTSAASEAASDQMDTLASRGIQFQNVFGALVYDLSGPLRDFLKMALVGLTDFSKLLLAITIPLKVAFGAAITAGVALLGVKLVQLINGLRSLPAVYAQWRADLAQTTALATGNAVAVDAVGSAVQRTSNIMSVVRWASIIGAVLSVLPLVTDGFTYLGKQMGLIPKSADEVEGALNETKNQLASTQQRIDSITSAIEKYDARSVDLTITQQDLDEMTAEITSRFAEFGLTIDGNVTKVSQLTDALVELNAQMLELQERELLQAKQQTEELIKTTGGDLERNLFSRAANAGAGRAGTPSLFGLTAEQNATVGRGRDYAKGNLPEGMNYNQLRGSLEAQMMVAEQLMQIDLDLARMRDRVTNEIGVAVNDPKRLEQLEETLRQITALQASLLPQVLQAKTMTTESDKIGGIERSISNNAILQTPEYQALLANARRVNTEMGTFKATVTNQNLAVVDEVEALMAGPNGAGLNGWRGQINDLNNVGDHVVRMFAKALMDAEDRAAGGPRTRTPAELDQLNIQARGQYNATEAAKQARQATGLLNTNFQTPEYIKNKNEGLSQDSSEAKARIEQINRLAKGKRRRPFEEMLGELNTAIDEYIAYEMQLVDFSFDRTDRNEAGELSENAKKRRAQRELELQTDADGFRETFAGAYNRRPDGSSSFGQIIETNERGASRIDAQIKKRLSEIDGQSSPQEMADVIDIVAGMFIDWERFKKAAQEAKYDAALWEDPSIDTEAMRQDFQDEIEAQREATVGKAEEMKRDAIAKLAQREAEARGELASSKLDGYLGKLRVYDDAGFDAAIAEVDKQVADIVKSAVEAFDLDPDNAERLGQLETERQKVIDDIMKTVPQLYAAVVEAYGKGLVQQTQRTANASRIDADRKEKRFSMFGLSSSTMFLQRRAADQDQLKVFAAEVTVAEKDALAAKDRRIAAQRAYNAASAEGRDQAERDLALQVQMELQSIDLLEQKRLAYEDAKISMMNMGDEIWNANKLLDIFVQGTFTSFADGLSTALEAGIADIENLGQAFEQLGDDILKTLQKLAAKILAEQILTTLISMFVSMGMSGAPWNQPGYVDPGSAGGAAYPNAPSADPGMAAYGFATGGIVRAAIGRGNPNRDSVLTLVQPGEGILRKSAMDMIGTDAFNEVNARGNRRLSQAGAAGAAAFAKQEPDMVNIYLVPKDAVPPTSKKEIVLAVSDDIAKNGQIKQLIQQVAIGGR